MAATGATYALAAAMKSSFPPNRCENSHIPAPLVVYEPSFVVHMLVPLLCLLFIIPSFDGGLTGILLGYYYELTRFNINGVLPVMPQYLQNHLKPALEFLKVKYPDIGQQTQVQDVCMIHLFCTTVCKLGGKVSESIGLLPWPLDVADNGPGPLWQGLRVE